MKKTNYGPFALLLLFHTTATFCEESRASLKDYTEIVHSIDRVPSEVKKVGTIDPLCVSCVKAIEVDKRLNLKNDDEDIGDLPFDKDDKPVVIHLLRTKSSPVKSTIHFKNNHSECSKTYTATNPIVNNGDVLMGCLMSKTVYEEEKLQLNFKKLPIPKEGEEQIIEIRLTKPRVTEGEYFVEAEVMKGLPSKNVKIEIDKKFWSQGYNLNFSEQEERR